MPSECFLLEFLVETLEAGEDVKDVDAVCTDELESESFV